MLVSMRVQLTYGFTGISIDQFNSEWAHHVAVFSLSSPLNPGLKLDTFLVPLASLKPWSSAGETLIAVIPRALRPN